MSRLKLLNYIRLLVQEYMLLQNIVFRKLAMLQKTYIQLHLKNIE